jgi:hypothetical protein
MKMKQVFLLVSIIFTVAQGYSQESGKQVACMHPLLIGTWKYGTGYSYSSAIMKIDSLKNASCNQDQAPCLWVFQSDGKYAIKCKKHLKKDNDIIEKGNYIMDEKNCEFTLDKKRKDGMSSYHIIYLDDKNLIITRPTPKGDFMYFLCR